MAGGPWTWVVTDQLTGTQIGRVDNPYECNWHDDLDGLDTSRFRLRLEDGLAKKIVDRLTNKVPGGVMCKVFDGPTLRFNGFLTTAEENGPNYQRIFSRENQVNQAFSIGRASDGTVLVRSAANTPSRDAWGLLETVVPYTADSSTLSQAYINQAVKELGDPTMTVTYQPSQQGDPGLVCNFGGPLWLLGKRLVKVTKPPIGPDQNSHIAWTLIDAVNLEFDTNIDQGVLGPTIVVTQDFGDPYISVAECLTSMAESKAFPFETPATWTDEDLFESAGGSGYLSDGSRTVAAGGTWTGGGSANDFVINPPWAQRGAWNDVNGFEGRYAVLSQVINGGVQVQTAVNYPTQRTGNGFLRAGVTCRYTSPTVNLKAVMTASSAGSAFDTLLVYKNWSTELDYTPLAFQPDIRYWLVLAADAAGRWACWCYPQSEPTPVAPTLFGYDPDLATGGPLANGKCGIYGANTSTTGGQNLLFDHLRAGPILQPLVWQGLDFKFAPQDLKTDGRIALFNASAELGTVKPNVIFDLGGGNTKVPVFGTDYIVGDQVKLRAKYKDQAQVDEGFVRVTSIDVTKDESKTVVSPRFDL